MLVPGLCAPPPQTEDQMMQRIESERNPVKKAKEEIRLARLKLGQVEDAYSNGQIEKGAGLLKALVDEMETSWKLLQSSGRKASKQPEGFRELEIALRENARALEDLQRKVSYFDRTPLADATQEFDRMRSEVLQALFPDDKTRNHKGPPAPQTAINPPNPAEVR